MSMVKMVMPMTIAACAVLAQCPDARAEELLFVTGEAGAAAPLNDPYGDTYGIGAEGAVGVFRSLMPQLALGLRAGYGVLTEEEDVQAGGYNFGLLTGVLRVRPLGTADDPGRVSGLWLEGGAGVGLVEDEARAVVTPALGYSFRAGNLGVGPFARYLQVIEDDFEDARVGILGVEVTLFGSGTPKRHVAPSATSTAAPLDTAAPAGGDRDGDGIPDDRDGCPDQAEIFNGINDHDGCPDGVLILFTNDRLVIDENVFFDYDKAELRPNGQNLLREIMSEYQKTSTTWGKLRIQGHADSRGSEEYNEQLSRERAQAVKQYLVSQGVPAELLDVEAYGERRPAVPGADTASEYQKNRRVEFAIERK